MSSHSDGSIFVHLRRELQYVNWSSSWEEAEKPKQDSEVKEGLSCLEFQFSSEKITMSRTNTGQVESRVTDSSSPKCFM